MIVLREKEEVSPCGDILDNKSIKTIEKILNLKNPIYMYCETIKYFNIYKGVPLAKYLICNKITKGEVLKEPRKIKSKHGSFITTKEEIFLREEIKKITSNGNKDTDHSKERRIERRFTNKKIEKVLESYSINEFRMIYDSYLINIDCRVTLRGDAYKYNEKTNEKIYSFIVISLLTEDLITCYETKLDKTEKEAIEEYTGLYKENNLDIINELKEAKKIQIKNNDEVFQVIKKQL